MTNKDLEAKVSATIRVATSLYDEMVADLDTLNYGFGWWHGYTDARRNALIAEYLIASVVGVRDALGNAAFCFETWTEQSYADDMWVRQTLRALGPNASDQDVLRSLHRTGNNQKRDVRIRLAGEHLYYHLAQAFDRIAAVFIGVCALDTSILKADWSAVADDGKFNRATSDRKRSGQPEAGAALQTSVREALLRSVEEAGPTDWHAWVDGKRNTNAHRAPKIQMVLTHSDSKKQPPRLLHLVERQPRWSMTEELVGNKGESMEEVWLMNDPAVVHEGCVASTARAIGEALTLFTDAWHQRKADPMMLVQPAGQWSNVLDQAPLAFEGYGDKTITMPTEGVVRVSPDTGRRMQATGVFDDKFWSVD